MKTEIIFKGLICWFLIFLVSCENEEFQAEQVIENEANITIDGFEYKSINELIGGNENCDNLYINTSYFDKNKIDFTLKISVSKNGNLLGVWYEEYILPSNTPQLKKIFLTPNFNPLSTFHISNFNYNSQNGEVEFNFYGIVFLESDNVIQRNISGAIKIKSLKSIACSVAKTGLNYNSENLNLYSYFNSSSKYFDFTQAHNFFSNNGFFITLRSQSDLWFYPIGEINFNENNLYDRVEFKEAIGPIIASQFQQFNLQQWKEYETSGKIVIEEKYVEKNQKLIRGKINLYVKYNGVEVYNLNNIQFKTISFEN